MREYLKRSLQKILIEKRHRLYEERIAKQAVPYGIWLKDVLEQEKADILTWRGNREKAGQETLSASLLSEEQFCESVFDEALRESLGELWLVTSDRAALTSEAVWEVKRYFEEHPACAIAYADEDRYLKPGWSPELLQSFFYVGNVFALRKLLVERVSEKMKCRACLHSKNVPDKGTFLLRRRLYDIVLGCIDEAKTAGHIEKILFLAGTASGQEKGFPKEEDIPAQYRDWGGEPAFDEIRRGHLYTAVEIPEEKEGQELVSVIIPSKDHPDLLIKCIRSLWEKTDYRNIEILVIDNGSNDKNKNNILRFQEQFGEEYPFCYFYRPMEFNFSALCNLGAKEAKGSYLLFLNDDIEAVEKSWLGVMVSQAAKDGAGAVGTKLLYPDSDTIQHLGVTNIHLGPAHKLQFASDKKEHYHGVNRCAVNVSAVTGACLLVRRQVFEETGGFSEELQVAFNDVEFCFRLLRAGYRNICCNNTFLYHHESASRGSDAGVEKTTRLHRERDILYEAYPEMWNRDDYYSEKLVRDILDRGYEPVCRFEEKRLSEKAAVSTVGGLKPVWHNESLFMGLEFTGDACAWRTGRSGGGDYYIQGWAYAVNVDNSRYETSLLLKPLREGDEREGGLWKAPYTPCYRPDFEENLSGVDRGALCGISLWIARDALPAGEYLIGCLWEDACSRQKLYGFSGEILTVLA